MTQTVTSSDFAISRDCATEIDFSMASGCHHSVLFQTWIGSVQQLPVSVTESEIGPQPQTAQTALVGHFLTMAFCLPVRGRLKQYALVQGRGF